ncbi:hypothetical protein IAD21_02287 [Abditibacteriota bacterium]|nr:hypothetical protein IAD21_02287 [Abditibacteriota bacterium]
MQLELEHPQIDQKSYALVSEVLTANTYEAPAVETILTEDSLESEVHYAGAQAVSSLDNG